MFHFDHWDELEKFLRTTGLVLKTQTPHVPDAGPPFGDPASPASLSLSRAIPASDWQIRSKTDDDGLAAAPAQVTVSAELFQHMTEQFEDDTSAVRRLTTSPVTRAFVYLDISDFSKMATGTQMLVINALVRIASGIQANWNEGGAEAQLCIGDGYIYVWKDPGHAARFAANLAVQIERDVAAKSVPEFHFRIGVHVGPVRCFWDPGRKDWNYVGEGINGGNRVLSAIGKDTDDVVFFSGELRSAIATSRTMAAELVKDLHNRGRRKDKHDRYWRVYELNHSAKQY